MRDVSRVGSVGLAFVEDLGGDRTARKHAAAATALNAAGVEGPLPHMSFPKRLAPRVDDGWMLSIAHSRPWLVAAAGCGHGLRLGVDVERCRARNFAGIGRFLDWPTPSTGALHFYRRWTLAEALYKAIGKAAQAWFRVLDHTTADPETDAFDAERNGWHWRVRFSRIDARTEDDAPSVLCCAAGSQS